MARVSPGWEGLPDYVVSRPRPGDAANWHGEHLVLPIPPRTLKVMCSVGEEEEAGAADGLSALGSSGAASVHYLTLVLEVRVVGGASHSLVQDGNPMQGRLLATSQVPVCVWPLPVPTVDVVFEPAQLTFPGGSGVGGTSAAAGVGAGSVVALPTPAPVSGAASAFSFPDAGEVLGLGPAAAACATDSTVAVMSEPPSPAYPPDLFLGIACCRLAPNDRLSGLARSDDSSLPAVSAASFVAVVREVGGGAPWPATLACPFVFGAIRVSYTPPHSTCPCTDTCSACVGPFVTRTHSPANVESHVTLRTHPSHSHVPEYFCTLGTLES